MGESGDTKTPKEPKDGQAAQDRHVPLGSLSLSLPLRGPSGWQPAGAEFKDGLRRAVERLEIEEAERERTKEAAGQGRKRRGRKDVTAEDVGRGLLWLMGDRETAVRVEWRAEGADADPAADKPSADTPASALAPELEPAPVPEQPPEDADASSDSDLSTPPGSPSLPPQRCSPAAPVVPTLPPAAPPAQTEEAPPPLQHTVRVRLALLPADYGWRVSQRRAAALRALFAVLDKGWDGAEGALLEVSVSPSLLPSLTPPLHLFDLPPSHLLLLSCGPFPHIHTPGSPRKLLYERPADSRPPTSQTCRRCTHSSSRRPTPPCPRAQRATRRSRRSRRTRTPSASRRRCTSTRL